MTPLDKFIAQKGLKKPKVAAPAPNPAAGTIADYFRKR